MMPLELKELIILRADESTLQEVYNTILKDIQINEIRQ